MLVVERETLGYRGPFRSWRLGVGEELAGAGQGAWVHHLQGLTGTHVLASVMSLFNPELET